MSLGKICRVLLQKPVYQQPIHSVRLYGRWTHRKPAKTILPFDFEPKGKVDLKREKVIDLNTDMLNKDQPNKDENNKEVSNKTMLSPEKSKIVKSLREEKLKKRKFYLSQKKVFDDNNEIIYEKLKENDGWVSSLLLKLKSKKERMRSAQTLVEGWRMIVDGLEAKCVLKYVLFSNVNDLANLRPFLPKTGVQFYKMSYKDIKLWSDVETPSGIFGVFETPTAENIKRLSRPLPLHFICDNIRVPGNLGAILRAAVGVGCEKVLLSKGCVDVWDPKVLRSAAGAHFRLPIHHSIDWDEMPNHMVEDTSVLIADSNSKVVVDSGEDFQCQIPVLPYYGIDYGTFQHITLIIGGETEGISENSYRLAASKQGLRVNIPLETGVDSLNTGMATAIIAFEIRKKLIQKWAKEKYGQEVAHAV